MPDARTYCDWTLFVCFLAVSISPRASRSSLELNCFDGYVLCYVSTCTITAIVQICYYYYYCIRAQYAFEHAEKYAVFNKRRAQLHARSLGGLTHTFGFLPDLTDSSMSIPNMRESRRCLVRTKGARLSAEFRRERRKRPRRCPNEWPLARAQRRTAAPLFHVARRVENPRRLAPRRSLVGGGRSPAVVRRIGNAAHENGSKT